MDSGTVTILFRDPSHGDDMLEVADLTTTGKLDSRGVGMEASFIPVPVSALLPRMRLLCLRIQDCSVC